MKKIVVFALVCLLVLSQITAFGYAAKKAATIDCIERDYTFLNQSEWTSFEGGDGYFAGIKADGSLWMWGDNSQGQIGVGLERERINAPVKVMEDVLNIYPSQDTNLVIKKDGSVWFFGGLDTSKPQKTGLKDVVEASMDNGRVAYVDSAGRAYVYNVKSGESVFLTDGAINVKMTFNSNIIETVGKKKKVLSIKEISKATMTAPSYIILIHKENGDVAEYYYGRYGNLDELSQKTVTLAENVSEMTASYINTYMYFAFRKADGTVIYGDSSGDRDMESVMIGGVKSVYNSVGGPLALKEDGTLWKWNIGYCYGNNVKFYASTVNGAVWMIDNNNKHYVLHENEKIQSSIESHFDKINSAVEYYEEKNKNIEYPDIYAKTMEIVEGETDKYRQAKLVSEWIARNIKYKHSEHDQSGVAAFREGTGVCAAYANLTDIMLGYLGIPTMYISGYTVAGSPHAWNAAIIDGSIVFIDNTGGEFDYDWIRQNQIGSQLIAARTDQWASEEMHGAYAYNLMADGRMRYGIKGDITRAEFCNLARKLIERTSGKDMDTILRESGKADVYANFTDTDSSDVLFLYKLGIINGKSDTVFAPNDTITRQEATVIMFNLSKFLGEDVNASPAEFADSADIASWAVEAVNYVVSKGIMKGKGNGFAPLDPISGQESVIICYRFFMERNPE